MDTENTNILPDDPAGALNGEDATELPTEETASSAELPQDKSGEDTGETPEVQAEAAMETSNEPNIEAGLTPTLESDDQADINKPVAEQTTPSSSDPGLPVWIQQISRYHDDMNGLLAGKENLKIMAVNTSARPSFYKKWVYEANQFARLTVNLRHRRRRALARLKQAETTIETKKTG